MASTLNRDRKQTLSQNYARLGLSSKLVAPSGGTEKHGSSRASTVHEADSLAIPTSQLKPGKIATQEIQVERDPTSGKILRVIRPSGSEDEDMADANPLNDALNDIEAHPLPEVKAATSVVEALEREAAEEASRLAQKKQPRKQSQREEEWIAKLVEKYGDDTAKMARDKKLNPMQQTAGDLKRRIKKWKGAAGVD